MIIFLRILVIIWEVIFGLIEPSMEAERSGSNWHYALIPVNIVLALILAVTCLEKFGNWWEDKKRKLYGVLFILGSLFCIGYAISLVFCAEYFGIKWLYFCAPLTGILGFLVFSGIVLFCNWLDIRTGGIWTLGKFVFLYRLGFAVTMILILWHYYQDLSSFLFWVGFVVMFLLWFVGRTVVLSDRSHIDVIAENIHRAGYIYTLFGVAATFMSLYAERFDLTRPVMLVGPLGLAIVTSILGVIGSGEIKRYQTNESVGSVDDIRGAVHDLGPEEKFSVLLEKRNDLLAKHLKFLEAGNTHYEHLTEQIIKASHLIQTNIDNLHGNVQKIAETSGAIPPQLKKISSQLSEVEGVFSQAKKLYEAIAKLLELELFRRR